MAAAVLSTADVQIAVDTAGPTAAARPPVGMQEAAEGVPRPTTAPGSSSLPAAAPAAAPAEATAPEEGMPSAAAAAVAAAAAAAAGYF
jgi:hypothetical protein